ncbi:TIGR03085 family protein [Corynebacterium yudongzhengii]|uniref:TIGR03085 family protein n=1 Tax=Corynebacterium yudongzhengii TaxID=2080740 RepID=A0A2U1T579_9CORY|nr:TIGR03085 family metal-binding protein [Corynebacterium yudongzhengii]AWB81734.1 TIGR03085 family protein [Corynebacterium yudongzhengii]PWC01167.1 TIGR03085 family protein [Corynebacterium yudongzhengii]
MSFSATERQRLADLLLDKGPDAPTLCEGWATRDLAAHLYVREHQPLAAAGMFVGPLNSRLEAAMQAQKDRDYESLVLDWAAGPPRLIPMRFLDTWVNAAEHFIHHEDVRRGDGVIEPREFSREVEKQFVRTLKAGASMFITAPGKPVVLTPPEDPPIVVGGKRGVAEKGDDVIRVSGAPGELLLWAYGRDAVEVDVTGDASVVKR